jgi:hypothetical protein
MERLWKEVVMASLWYNARKITENKSVRVTDVLMILKWAPPKHKYRELSEHKSA